MTSGAFTGAASGYTTRIITNPDADIVEDRIVTATGTYSAGASQSGSAAWLMQLVAFRGAAQ
jgi:O-acetylhomoserine/O-acetylserine sulfhydrylase-like pyridoxal-dependent enzyme